MYNNEGSIVFSTEVVGAGDIIATMVDDEGNTLTSLVDDKTDSITIVDLYNDPFILEFFDCSDYDVSSVVSSQSSISSNCCCFYPECYQPPPPKDRQLCTNKHKSYRFYVSFHDFLNGDNTLVPGLSDCFNNPCSFLLNALGCDSLPSQYDSVLQDDVNGLCMVLVHVAFLHLLAYIQIVIMLFLHTLALMFLVIVCCSLSLVLLQYNNSLSNHFCMGMLLVLFFLSGVHPLYSHI